jgi:hypothetical protein
MEHVYLLIYGNEWEDITVFLSVEDAIRESINHPNKRVEVFSKKSDKPGYSPTYNYYENGKYIQNS